jgi:outer membrane immunogenic protein
MHRGLLMHRFRFIALAAVALFAFASVASAADLPVKAAVYNAAPIVVDNWTGCYIGGNVGGAWSGKSYTAGPPGYWNDVGQSDGSHTSSGGAGGGQIGCDHQFANTWVIGVQGMWDAARLKDDNPIPNFFVCCDARLDSDVRSFGTVTGRLGYLLNPTLLFSGKAGWGWVNERFTNTCPAQNACGGMVSVTRGGFDAGLAMTWMFNPNWDLFVDYDHMWLGSKNINFPPAIATSAFQESVKQSFDKIVVGIDYRFRIH